MWIFDTNQIQYNVQPDDEVTWKVGSKLKATVAQNKQKKKWENKMVTRYSSRLLKGEGPSHNQLNQK